MRIVLLNEDTGNMIRPNIFGPLGEKGLQGGAEKA